MRPLPARVARALLLGAALASAGAGPTPLKDAYIGRFTGAPAPPFVLKDLRGREVRLADYRGKVVLLNFWYSACFPCRVETPDLIALYRAHRDRGLVILAVNTDRILLPEDDGAMLRKFVDTYRVPYPVLLADRKMWEDYGRTPIAPITLLIDRQGTIARVFWGAFPGPAYERALLPYLEARADASAKPSAASGPGP